MYKFDGVAVHDVQIRSHGNSKDNLPYCRIMKSTSDCLKEQLQSKSPKDAISSVMKLKGGIMNAAELPLCHQKVYDLNRQLKVKSSCGTRVSSVSSSR